MSSFCIAKTPTPMLNTPEFQQVFGSKVLPLDKKGLLRSLEMIALPGTKFEIHQKIGPYTLEVTTQDYPTKTFIDARFVSPASANTPERAKVLPSPDLILDRLKSALGLPYVWGGNYRQGIPEILSLYQSPSPTELHTLAGLDCSGLLYEATGGYTPRNTSELLKFGEEISSIEKIKPLDILVYPGHVIILLDQGTTIESRYGHGVVLANLSNRLAELTNTKFLIRRFLSIENS